MDTPVLPHIPALIAAYMRAAAGRRSGGRAGPFTTGLDPHSDDPMRNYAAAVQHHAYQLPRPPGPHDIARLTRLAQCGGLVAIAVDDSSGTVTGTGLVDVTGDRPAVGELAAVGVLTAFRRRGIASALSAYLARTAHSRGIGLVFLESRRLATGLCSPPSAPRPPRSGTARPSTG